MFTARSYNEAACSTIVDVLVSVLLWSQSVIDVFEIVHPLVSSGQKNYVDVEDLSDFKGFVLASNLTLVWLSATTG